MIFYDYEISKDCVNDEVYFICHKCGRCGRKFAGGYLLSCHKNTSADIDEDEEE